MLFMYVDVWYSTKLTSTKLFRFLILVKMSPIFFYNIEVTKTKQKIFISCAAVIIPRSVYGDHVFVCMITFCFFLRYWRGVRAYENNNIIKISTQYFEKIVIILLFFVKQNFLRHALRQDKLHIIFQEYTTLHENWFFWHINCKIYYGLWKKMVNFEIFRIFENFWNVLKRGKGGTVTFFLVNIFLNNYSTGFLKFSCT